MAKGKQGKGKGAQKATTKATSTNAAKAEGSAENKVANDHNYRMSTGVLTSQPRALDVKISGFTLQSYGKVLIQETEIELTIGRRYGLIGSNGSGKTTFLRCLGHREVPIPDHIDIHLLENEAEPSDLNALEWVVHEAQQEVKRLEEYVEKIVEKQAAAAEAGDEEGAEASDESDTDALIQDIYARLDELDPDTFDVRAGRLLTGLGFDRTMLAKATKDMSGGWRMRVALAKALFIKPSLLLLDEPTNHLDLEAVVWLEEYLRGYERCLVVVSHSQDFLNNVCTNIIHLTPKKTLTYYGGNYDTFVQTKAELEVNQMKAYKKEQEDIAKIKQFVASAGTYANLVRQAKSKLKIIEKMEERGLTEKVERDASFKFRFPDCEKLPPPILMFENVGFSYDGNIDHALYRHLSFGVDQDSRVALVGPNGAGKSTLLKLMLGEISPTEGQIRKHMHITFARYNQHSNDVLNAEMTPLDFVPTMFPDKKLEEQGWRALIGKYGITGVMQTTKIGQLSDGMKTRIIFCLISMQHPHILLLDEPTNHLDMECFTPDHQLLTSTGFKWVADITEDDAIGTYNEQTQQIEYRKPVAGGVVHRPLRQGEQLIEFATAAEVCRWGQSSNDYDGSRGFAKNGVKQYSNRVSLVVTAGHDMYVQQSVRNARNTAGRSKNYQSIFDKAWVKQKAADVQQATSDVKLLARAANGVCVDSKIHAVSDALGLVDESTTSERLLHGSMDDTFSVRVSDTLSLPALATAEVGLSSMVSTNNAQHVCECGKTYDQRKLLLEHIRLKHDSEMLQRVKETIKRKAPELSYSERHIQWLHRPLDMTPVTAEQRQRFEFVNALHLATQDHVVSFLELYGYFLGDGSVTYSQQYNGQIHGYNSVMFSPTNQYDKTYLPLVLHRLGLVHGDDFSVVHVNKRIVDKSNGKTCTVMYDCYYVHRPAWFDYFHRLHGNRYKWGKRYGGHDHSDDDQSIVNSAKWVAKWVWQCDKTALRHVIEGLRIADGFENGSDFRIYTSSARFRDEVVRILLHAGYTAQFETVYNKGDDRSIVKTGHNHDHWQISYSESPSSAEPKLNPDTDMKVIDAGRYSTVHCVTVPPHHLVIARRAHANSEGVVTKASRPVIVGQCIDSLAEAINQYQGGLVLVSHDFRLLSQVARQIWVCDKKTVKPWSGDIASYKRSLVQRMRAEDTDFQTKLKNLKLTTSK